MCALDRITKSYGMKVMSGQHILEIEDQYSCLHIINSKRIAIAKTKGLYLLRSSAPVYEACSFGYSGLSSLQGRPDN